MEKNRKAIDRAIRKLPEYQPGDGLWQKISNRLMPDLPAEAISNLKELEPPVNIWQSIDHQLSLKENASKKARSLKLVYWSLAASAILVLGFIIFSPKGFHQNRLNYSEEWLTVTQISDSTENDSLAYRKLAEKCESKPEVCKSGEFIKLKKELDFLDQSRQIIISQSTPYDNNKDMQVVLERIDAERSDILDRLMAYADR